ncbi:MAG: hypothetical protein R2818_11470 [Flavobacteriales bacterium]
MTRSFIPAEHSRWLISGPLSTSLKVMMLAGQGGMEHWTEAAAATAAALPQVTMHTEATSNLD